MITSPSIPHKFIVNWRLTCAIFDGLSFELFQNLSLLYFEDTWSFICSIQLNKFIGLSETE